MHALNTRLGYAAISALFALALTASCGSEIGDSCAFSTDCSPNGDRLCDTESSGGYCTVFGCDHDTCPGGSTCVRFFSVNTTNLPCDPATEDRGGAPTDDCGPEDLCALTGTCVPRLAEARFCMKTCDGNGDCRDGYECRTLELMRQHGGEPVPAPGESPLDRIAPFCAENPVPPGA